MMQFTNVQVNIYQSKVYNKKETKEDPFCIAILVNKTLFICTTYT